MMFPLRTILYATDFSGPSEHAFQAAGALARTYQARIVALHVVDHSLVGFTEGIVRPPSPAEREELTERLRQLGRSCPGAALECRLADGEAAPLILWAAEETGCDLIVLGTHGRSGLGRLLLGSVAEEVIRKAPCPVLTVRAPVAVSDLPTPHGGRAVNSGK
jgi:nucleotide-binding universal stress UspA family protein